MLIKLITRKKGMDKKGMDSGVSAAGMCYLDADGRQEYKLDAISMPDNGSNCPIKTRNDVTALRNAITLASMLSRTHYY